VLAVAALLALRRGLMLFLQGRADSGEAWLVLGAAACGFALADLLEADHARVLRLSVATGAMLWMLARTAFQAWPPLRQEFGDRIAFFLIAPLLAGASLLLVRIAVALPGVPSAVLASEAGLDFALATLALMLGVLLHCNLAAAVMLRMVAKLRRLSQRDPLTGLLNRAEWLRRLASQHHWLGRFGEPYSLLMIDIDHFKAINDAHGHAAGDTVLTALAQILMGGARDMDVVGRVGGEEFCMLLPRTDPVSARRTAERLRQTVAETDVRWQQQAMRLTVSIGLAVADDPEEPPQVLMDRVEQALTQAKRAGRNRTAMARAARAVVG
jgi:diguanylate cyclase (GGDEF)-like protein